MNINKHKTKFHISITVIILNKLSIFCQEKYANFTNYTVMEV